MTSFCFKIKKKKEEEEDIFLFKLIIFIMTDDLN